MFVICAKEKCENAIVIYQAFVFGFAYDPPVSILTGNLATEVNLIVLDMLEHVIHVATVVEANYTSSLLSGVMRVILYALSVNQSTRALTSYFATQRAMVSKFLLLLFQVCLDK